jgi:hypothetical protein
MIEGLSIVHLFWIAVIAAMWLVPIALVVLFVMRARRPSQPDPRATRAERLHRGEITREQFDTSMQALGAPPASVTWSQPPAAADTETGPRQPPRPPDA